MNHEDCMLHGPMQNAILNTEIQYGKINEKLEIIEKSITDINTKFAVLESHKVIEKLEKIPLQPEKENPEIQTNTNNWFKISIALVGVITTLLGILAGKSL